MNPYTNADAPAQAAAPGPRVTSDKSKDRLLKLLCEVSEIKDNGIAKDEDIVAVVVNAIGWREFPALEGPLNFEAIAWKNKRDRKKKERAERLAKEDWERSWAHYIKTGLGEEARKRRREVEQQEERCSKWVAQQQHHLHEQQQEQQREAPIKWETPSPPTKRIKFETPSSPAKSIKQELLSD
ncbi:hypothetical protein B0T14DRAFT_496625 [Immersiella caudata]|uniref:Uncharacterized protein n=1 Tax=Immersiella caudata TaxID=314043 RepID=A0AA40BZP0_9PEZI|nr:hypothetical protein B0T14DRAFT_496625 [Immersiella caudata]